MSGTRNWSVDDYKDKLLPRRGQLISQFSLVQRKNVCKADITDELLEECYLFTAQIVEVFGDKYLPIFERLHAEIQIRKERRETLKKALKIARTKQPE